MYIHPHKLLYSKKLQEYLVFDIKIIKRVKLAKKILNKWKKAIP